MSKSPQLTHCPFRVTFLEEEDSIETGIAAETNSPKKKIGGEAYIIADGLPKWQGKGFDWAHEDSQSRLQGEAWVAFTPEDRVGLALSGGGIRSATFSLGMLHALDHLGMLKDVHYLSTVSGGGYTGAFWTRWRHEQSLRTEAAEAKLKECKLNQEQECSERIDEGYARLQKPPNKDPLEEIIAPPLIICGCLLKTLELHKSKNESVPASIPENRSGPWNHSPTVVSMESQAEIRETAEVRHLREFSHFLSPRLRSINREMWSVITTILGGLAPSVLAGVCFIFGLGSLWLVLATIVEPAGLLGSIPEKSNSSFNFWAYALFIFVWSFVGHISRLDRGNMGPSIFTLVWKLFFKNPPDKKEPSKEKTWQEKEMDILIELRKPQKWFHLLWIVITTWIAALSWLYTVESHIMDGYASIYRPAASLAAIVIVTMSLRSAFARFNPKWLHPRTDDKFEQCLSGLLSLAAVWSVLAGLWSLSGLLLNGTKDYFTAQHSTIPVALPALLAAILSIYFPKAKRHLTELPEAVQPLNLLEKFKRTAPMVIALSVCMLLLLAANISLHLLIRLDLEKALKFGPVPTWQLTECLWRTPLICFASAFLCQSLVTFFYDPNKFGLHGFYRARISRCFLGAARSADPARNNRYTTFDPEDDMPLSEDKGLPIHLICTAANHLSGDRLDSLSRGAVSATMSRFGMTLGGVTTTAPKEGKPQEHAAPKEWLLSQAITASAAAFNPNMGYQSIALGWPVSFMLAMLNLRLGWWVSRVQHWKIFPGGRFVGEMFGHLRRDHQSVHLSDGGHFENLGVYELIRRHCRYIIVIDASADPKVTFDDLANLSRRVRQDFGVEIEIDLTRLKPDGKNRSAAHFAVGTVHYDGTVGIDKGILVYFKPTLTGDEAVDVEQYQARNTAFPHESTGDQFYDEAQWESYRKLGFHSALNAFRFLSDLPDERRTTSEIFRRIRLNAEDTHWAEQANNAQLIAKSATLEKLLSDDSSNETTKAWVAEMIGAPNSGSPDPTDLFKVLQTLQFCEEVWYNCSLQKYWSHPLARPWMTYLIRLTSLPLLHKWWPLLRPIYGAAFGRFAERHLGLSGPPKISQHDRIAWLKAKQEGPSETGYAWHSWRKRWDCGSPPLNPPEGFSSVTFSLNLILPEGIEINAGAAILYQNDQLVTWDMGNIYIPAALRGGSFTTKFVDLLLQEMKTFKPNATILRVVVRGLSSSDPSGGIPPTGLSPAQVRERTELVEFYKTCGFKLTRGTSNGAPFLERLL